MGTLGPAAAILCFIERFPLSLWKLIYTIDLGAKCVPCVLYWMLCSYNSVGSVSLTSSLISLSLCRSGSYRGSLPRHPPPVPKSIQFQVSLIFLSKYDILLSQSLAKKTQSKASNAGIGGASNGSAPVNNSTSAGDVSAKPEKAEGSELPQNTAASTSISPTSKLQLQLQFSELI